MVALALIRWNADPVLTHFGDLAIRWYTVLFLLGVVTVERVMTWQLGRRGLPADRVGPLMLWCLGGTILGAHLGHVLFYEPWTVLEDPERLLRIGSGLASHGGAVGGVVGALLYARRNKVPFYPHADIASLGFYCLIPFIRIGNFFNSEIYGRVTSAPWGVIFERRGFTEPRHPSQLYEAAMGLVFLGLCFWLERRYRQRLRPGLLFYLLPGVYCITRFLIEWVKEYQVLSPAFPLTMGQLLSVPVVLFCGFMIWRGGLYRLRDAEAVERSLLP